MIIIIRGLGRFINLATRQSATAVVLAVVHEVSALLLDHLPQATHSGIAATRGRAVGRCSLLSPTGARPSRGRLSAAPATPLPLPTTACARPPARCLWRGQATTCRARARQPRARASARRRTPASRSSSRQARPRPPLTGAATEQRAQRSHRRRRGRRVRCRRRAPPPPSSGRTVSSGEGAEEGGETGGWGRGRGVAREGTTS